MPDPMDTLKVPAALLDDAVANLFQGMMLPLGEEALQQIAKSVICTVADYLADDQVQRAVEQRIDHETQGDLLPDHPYDRQNATSAAIAAVLHTIGVR